MYTKQRANDALYIAYICKGSMLAQGPVSQGAQILPPRFLPAVLRGAVGEDAPGAAVAFVLRSGVVPIKGTTFVPKVVVC